TKGSHQSVSLPEEVSESSEVKGVCPESEPKPRENRNFGSVPIPYGRSQAKRASRNRQVATDTPGSQTASSLK
ncbi:MAG: hypothetical protein V3R93_00005, partial [Candidatus Hydrothermarchaeaceae archaeon]